eukprot:GFUD01025477.1.p1 GENE.GFUD01025477.1~~GFUD01025477.1.p1  ORF type:complete len:454 (+),score=67.27 GFUD01025477.1:49-1410(+)
MLLTAFLLLPTLFSNGLGLKFFNKPIRKAFSLTHFNESPLATPVLIPSFSTATIIPEKAEEISSLLQRIPKINSKAVEPKSVHTSRSKIDLGSLVQKVESENYLQKIGKSMNAAVVAKKDAGLQINAKSKKAVLAENNLQKIAEETYHPAVSEQSVDSGTADVQGFKVEGDTSNKIVFIDLEKLREAGFIFDNFKDLSLGSSGGKTLEQFGSQTSSSNFNSVIEETIRKQESSTYSSQPIIATQQVIAYDPDSSQVSRGPGEGVPDSVSSSSSQVPSKPSVSTATQQVVPVGVKVVDLSRVPIGASQVFPSSLVPAGANQVIGVSQVLGSSSVNKFPPPIQTRGYSLEQKLSSIPIQVVGSSRVPTGANQVIASSQVPRGANQVIASSSVNKVVSLSPIPARVPSFKQTIHPVFFKKQQYGGNYAIQKPKILPAKKASALSFASFPSFPAIRK